MPEDDDLLMAMRQRRALYRACHRGTREMDFLFGVFAKARVAGMSLDELALFEQVLELPDPVLTAALVDGVSPEGVVSDDGGGAFSSEHGAFLQRVSAFHKNNKA